MNEKKVTPYALLTVGEDVFKIQFTMYSCLKHKLLTGKNLLKGELDINEPSDLIHFLWAGLVQHQPDYDGDLIEGKPSPELQKSLDKIAKMMTFERFGNIGAALKESFFNAMPNRAPSEESSEDKAEKK